MHIRLREGRGEGAGKLRNSKVKLSWWWVGGWWLYEKRVAVTVRLRLALSYL